MTVRETPPIRLHDDSALFKEAVTYTAAETGFAPRLIEKDYFCTVLLQCLGAAGSIWCSRAALAWPRRMPGSTG
jgi:hypothetical protein